MPTEPPKITIWDELSGLTIGRVLVRMWAWKFSVGMSCHICCFWSLKDPNNCNFSIESRENSTSTPQKTYKKPPSLQLEWDALATCIDGIWSHSFFSKSNRKQWLRELVSASYPPPVRKACWLLVLVKLMNFFASPGNLVSIRTLKLPVILTNSKARVYLWVS